MAASFPSQTGRGSSVVPWLAWLLGLAGLLAALYCFYNANQIGSRTIEREGLVQQMQNQSVQLRQAWLQDASSDSLKDPLDEFEQARVAFASSAGVTRAAPVDDLSGNVDAAFDDLKVELAKSPLQDLLEGSNEPATGAGAQPKPQAAPTETRVPGSLADDLGLLVEVSAALRARLAEIDAPAMQIEPTGHLYQLAVTLRKRLVLDAASSTDGGSTNTQALDPVRSTRGPWLVFNQILQRVEAMLGTREITDENAVALTSDLRAHQVELEKKLTPVFAGQTSLASLTVTPAESAEEEPANSLESTLEATNEARQALSARHNLLDDSLDALQTAEATGRENQSLWNLLGLLSGLVGTAILSILALGLMRSLRRERASQNINDEKQEESILLLLDEISQLAEGDLRTQATVTDGVTGSIADSVNYAVTELRRLVGTMSTSAERVQVAVEETGTTARQLANASVVQSREIGRSSAYTKAMADTMEQLSTRASEANAIATKSASLSVSARSSIEKTQGRVGNVKQKTAEASRLMQRLGDSSTQISRSVKLMDQVAEKTRLLAMNTAIRARSGESSGGSDALAADMSGVAEQVRGLANRLGQSAGEIETLVSVVRQDVAATIESMRSIDGEVDAVSVQATDAGRAMMQIEAVSERLKQIVDTIDGRIERQSKVVKQLSNNMGVINDVTRHSAHGLQLSASSLEDLRLMATELKDGVAEFSLPEHDRQAIAQRTEEIRNHVHVGAGSETMAVRAADLTMTDGADRTSGATNRFDATSDYPAVTSRHHHDVTFFGKQGDAQVDEDRFDERTIAIQSEVARAMGADRKGEATRATPATALSGTGTMDHDSTIVMGQSEHAATMGGASGAASGAALGVTQGITAERTQHTSHNNLSDRHDESVDLTGHASFDDSVDESLIFDTVVEPDFDETFDRHFDKSDFDGSAVDNSDDTLALSRSDRDKGSVE